MSQMVNIGGDKADASYRYKMPRLVTKVEGRGNGIKTVIVNMVDISKALHVDPGYPTKYFGIELGAQSKFNADTERAVVNGCHEQADMAKMLDKFVATFVLCPTCGLPEITMNIKKSSVKIDCAACGHNGALATTHKLLTYILKKNADLKGGKDKKKKKDKDKDKKKDKKKKKDKDKDKEEEGAAATENGQEEATEGDTKKKKKAEEEETVEWLTDTSKSAQKKRKEAEFADMQNNEFIKDVDAIMAQANVSGETSASVVLRVFLASGNRSITDIVNEVRRLQLARDLGEPERIKVVLESVIDVSNPAKVADEYKKNAELLQQFTKTPNSGNIFLNVLEEQLGVNHPQLLSRTPLIIQALYEGDVLDEETIISWFSSPPESSWLVTKDVAVAVRKKAEPLITWLRDAEEDDEGDEEE